MATIANLQVNLDRIKRLGSPETKRKVGAALYAGGDIIRTDAALSIVRGAIQGKGHVPSKPGEPPKRDTGHLDTSIVTVPPNADYVVEVRAEAPHAVPLEYGTSKMAERPFMRPALARNKEKVRALVERAVDQIVKDVS